MKGKIVLVGFALLVVLDVLIFGRMKFNSNIDKESYEIQKFNDKKILLQNFLEEMNRCDENVQELILQETDKQTVIDGRDVLVFELRFKENLENVGGRLLEYYAITTDQKKVYYINPAMEDWELLYESGAFLKGAAFMSELGKRPSAG